MDRHWTGKKRKTGDAYQANMSSNPKYEEYACRYSSVYRQIIRRDFSFMCKISIILK